MGEKIAVPLEIPFAQFFKYAQGIVAVTVSKARQHIGAVEPWPYRSIVVIAAFEAKSLLLQPLIKVESAASDASGASNRVVSSVSVSFITLIQMNSLSPRFRSSCARSQRECELRK